MSERSERLRRARRQAGFETAADAAQEYGWAVSTYSGHENGSRCLRADVARKYAQRFRVSPEWLLFGRGAPEETRPTENETPPTDGAGLVPVYDVEVSAGDGTLPADVEAQVDQLAFPPGYLRRITSAPVRHLAIVTVKGDSMSPTLREGDVVMIDTTKRSLGYDGLFVLRMDGALHCKRVNRGSKAGLVRILSDNRDVYPPAERPIEEVGAVGKVLWYGRKQ